MLRVLISAIACAAGVVLAQPALDLNTAVRSALDHHPLLAAGSAQIDAAAGLLTQASLRPNPRAAIQTENWRFKGAPQFSPSTEVDTFAYASQLFETASKRRLRTELAATGVRRSELNRELVAKQIAGRVRMAYWMAVGAQRVHDLFEENVGTFDQIVRYHELRVKEGAMAEADLLKVRLERERVAVAALAADLEAQRARIELQREMGETSFVEVRLTDALEPLPPMADASEDTALANRTELKLAQQAMEQAQANLKVQQSLARPDFEVVGGYKHTGGAGTVIGGVQVPLPFANRNQGNIASATADIRVAESQAAATRAIVLAEVRAAMAEVQNRRRQLTGLFPGIRSQANESSRISQAAYREGGWDLLRLLDTERVRIETEVLYYRTLAEYRQSLAALELALGVAP